jgi:endonuclease YncB( thermonuclease family)
MNASFMLGDSSADIAGEGSRIVSRHFPPPFVPKAGALGSPNIWPGRRLVTGRRRVTRVIDGDTLELEPGERVRLIGVDCPELDEPLGPVVATWVRQRVAARFVRLSFDPATTISGHRDRYGRTLAYVWLANGRLLNRELVRVGYATVELGFPCMWTGRFLRAEDEAQRQARGLWETPHRCVQRVFRRGRESRS